jgi:chromosome segregation ATPase
MTNRTPIAGAVNLKTLLELKMSTNKEMLADMRKIILLQDHINTLQLELHNLSILNRDLTDNAIHEKKSSSRAAKDIENLKLVVKNINIDIDTQCSLLHDRNIEIDRLRSLLHDAKEGLEDIQCTLKTLSTKLL